MSVDSQTGVLGQSAESAIHQGEKILYDLSVPCEWPEVVTVLVRWFIHRALNVMHIYI